MRQSLCVLLVVLALFFNQANAKACPALVVECAEFLNVNKVLFKKSLEKFGAPPEAVEAKLKVKECIDQISTLDRILIDKALGEIVVKCDFGKSS